MKVGERAPEFNLDTANEGHAWKVGDPISLAQVIERGSGIVEFLRGTW